MTKCLNIEYVKKKLTNLFETTCKTVKILLWSKMRTTSSTKLFGYLKKVKRFPITTISAWNTSLSFR